MSADWAKIHTEETRFFETFKGVNAAVDRLQTGEDAFIVRIGDQFLSKESLTKRSEAQVWPTYCEAYDAAKKVHWLFEVIKL